MARRQRVIVLVTIAALVALPILAARPFVDRGHVEYFDPLTGKHVDRPTNGGLPPAPVRCAHGAFSHVYFASNSQGTVRFTACDSAVSHRKRGLFAAELGVAAAASVALVAPRRRRASRR